MAKLIVAIDIAEGIAQDIERQAAVFPHVEFDDTGTPKGFFNPNGQIAIEAVDLEEDPYSPDDFFVFEYRGVERIQSRED